MSNARKPYVKQLSHERYIVIFSQDNNIFFDHVIAFCIKEGFLFNKEKTKTGRIKLRLSCSGVGASQLKIFIRNEYDEFHHYNKEIIRRIKSDKLI
jgi:hypothetical protein